MALELRPICEHCGKSLPPDALDARICSFECTFCSACVDGLLGDVCPNCGGGFCPRPVRPAKNWRGDNFLGGIDEINDESEDDDFSDFLAKADIDRLKEAARKPRPPVKDGE